MKNIWSWIKGHWVVVVCCALIVLTLPVAFFVSRGWSGSIRTRQEKAANDLLTKLTGAAKVGYAVPSVVPGVPPVEQSAEPNARRTAYFKEQKDLLTGQGTGVVKLAEQFNARGHKPIMEGIFPDPAPGQDVDSITLEFAERIVGRSAGPGATAVPSVYQQLFDRIKAGPPSDPMRLATLLEDRQQREIEKIKGTDPARQLTPEEQTQLTKTLVEARIGEYQRRANEITVYATMDSLPGPTEARTGGSWVPREMPKSPPPVWECYVWQWDYWVIEDLLAAVAKANSGADGVDESVVKRIDRIELDSAGFDTTHRDSAGSEGAEAVVPSETAQVAPDYKYSLTGRAGAPVNMANGVYDIRRADITVVVSSQRLPQLLDALSATNFMTVLDCDLTEVDVWRDLAMGYYYGNEHVVQAKIAVETVWLRSVTKPFMPAKVRTAFGIPDEEKKGAEGTEGAEPAPEGKG